MRRRATRAAAAAPKSRIIGGAGTGVPPVELVPVELLPVDVLFPVEVSLPVEVLLPDEELLVELEELVLDEVELELVELVLIPPKLLEEVLDEVETLPLEEVETLPLDEDEVDTLPLEDDEVETLPLELVEDTPSCAAAIAGSERRRAARVRRRVMMDPLDSSRTKGLGSSRPAPQAALFGRAEAGRLT
jgi:hypothetical protein